ncbi:bifunctional lysylphosphatidylglycerol synthetase/lysine--tRNA ligase LysX [Intrasporangium mesophilum]
MGKRVAASPPRHRSARLLTAILAVATFAAVLLAVFDRGPHRPGLAELFFGLLNIPVAPTLLSVVVLALVTRALLGRKRIGLWAVVAFQVAGIYLGIVALLPSAPLPFDELWDTRGDFSRGLEVAAMVVAIAMLWWLWRLHSVFTARLQPGSWWLALTALAVGTLVTLGVTSLMLDATGAPQGQVTGVVATVLAGIGGVSRRSLAGIPPFVVDVTAVLATATILASVGLFLASSRARSRWSPDREVALRSLLAEYGAEDSLGYFATRRDKASVFAPDGRAAVTYRVVNGVSLASADPVGAGDAWAAAIAAWQAEAREFGWLPAVLSASEAGARAYAAAGLRVMLMGDEAILDPERFDLRRGSLGAVRHAVKHARRAGISIRVRRQDDISIDELATLMGQAEAWRGDDGERGFSMALGRAADPADGRIVYVTAHEEGGVVVGLLTFVPWGRSGLSLDLMRRSPQAPNGVTELSVAELLGRSRQLGVTRVSLNFCMFRGIFADSARLGARPITRFNASLLGVLDRVWQLESLYRANAKLEPTWEPRFLCYDDAVSMPQVLVAAGAAEGFLPWPGRGHAVQAPLDPEHLELVESTVATVEARAEHQALVRHRSGQFGHRLARLEAMRAAGRDPFPVGGGQPTTTLPALSALLSESLVLDRPGRVLASTRGGRVGVAARPLTGCLAASHVHRDGHSTAPRVGLRDDDGHTRDDGPVLSVVGRVRDLRDHGSVVFATLVDGRIAVQVVLDPSTAGSPDEVRDFARFVDRGDLVRVEGTAGASRNGTPSLILRSWRMEAKSLHPLPFRALSDPEARLRQRSADLVVHPETVSLLRCRSQVVAAVRDTLGGLGFTEVETPMLNTVHGGATARPFRTFSNAYGLDLSLRIAPELHLKRLLVGGLGPIFELGRSFRNEGADATHNPEFTSLEVYQPHADYATMRILAEQVIKAAARRVHGREAIPIPGAGQARTGAVGADLVDVSAPWPVVRVLDAVSGAVGERVSLETDPDRLIELAHAHGVTVPADRGPGAIIEELYAELVEAVTAMPTFYVDFPQETSPLTRPHRAVPGLVERWDLVIAGMEVGTAYSELTDPVDQRNRLTEQSIRAAAGDPEAMAVDEDFLFALELGMPPSGGLGIGIDRLVMLLTNTSIRQVLTFPFVRPLETAGPGGGR